MARSKNGRRFRRKFTRLILLKFKLRSGPCWGPDLFLLLLVHEEGHSPDVPLYAGLLEHSNHRPPPCGILSFRNEPTGFSSYCIIKIQYAPLEHSAFLWCTRRDILLTYRSMRDYSSTQIIVPRLAGSSVFVTNPLGSRPTVL